MRQKVQVCISCKVLCCEVQWSFSAGLEQALLYFFLFLALGEVVFAALEHTRQSALLKIVIRRQRCLYVIAYPLRPFKERLA